MHHSLYYTQQHWRAWTGPFQRASVPDVSYCNPVTLFPIVWLKSSPLVCPLHVAYKSGIQTFLENIKRFECILIHAVCWTQAPAIYIQAGSSDSTWSSSWLLWGGCLGCVAIHLPAITPSLPINEPAWKFHCARKQVKASQGTAVCHTVSFRHIPSIFSMPLCQLVAEALCHVGLPHSRSSFFFMSELTFIMPPCSSWVSTHLEPLDSPLRFQYHLRVSSDLTVYRGHSSCCIEERTETLCNSPRWHSSRMRTDSGAHIVLLLTLCCRF